MKASVYSRYGGPEVISIEDIPTPEPRVGEVLVAVHATTVSAGDWRMRSLDLPPGFGPVGRLMAGVFGPRQPVLGSDFAGRIVAVGSKVTRWSVGDAVIGSRSAKMGTHAEFVTVPEDGTIVAKPETMSFADAAAIPFGGLTALEFLRDKGGLKAGERVLIVGASGAVGSAAVQLARHFGAHVTGVSSAANHDLLHRLGAERAIDYRATDIATLPERYDMILDTTGTAPWRRVRHLLMPRGRLVVVNGSLGDLLRSMLPRRPGRPRLIGGISGGTAAGLRLLVGLAETGQFAPLIERIYPFKHIARAHALVDSGRKKGSVVVAIRPEGGERKLAA